MKSTFKLNNLKIRRKCPSKNPLRKLKFGGKMKSKINSPNKFNFKVANNKISKKTFFVETLVVSSIFGVSALGFSAWRYKVAEPDQYLVRTGLGLSDIDISKKCFHFPFQRYSRISMNPVSYEFSLDAMSSQKMEFILPGVFLIGPENDMSALQKYSRYLSSQQDAKSLDHLIRGIIEGETRVLSAKMTIEELFNNRDRFKEEIINNIQLELDQFGLKIFNANIKELQDAPGSEYFQFMRQKTRSQAESKAQIDISEAKKNADIAVKERVVLTRVETSKLETEAIFVETENNKKIAMLNADLGKTKAESKKLIGFADTIAEKEVEKLEANMQKEVEIARANQQLESKRADDLTEATVTAETIKVSADAYLYKSNQHADADKYAANARSDAHLYEKEKEAEGIEQVLKKNAAGIEDLATVFDNNENLLKFLMIQRGTYETLAKTNAEAIKGMEPKITVWNTGSGSSGDKYSDTIKNVMTNLPPLFETIHDQTGMKPGKWIVDGLNENDKTVRGNVRL